MKNDKADPLALWVSYALLVTAFVGSYSHVVEAVSRWGQTGWMAYAIAAMPEATVLIGMRKLLTRSMTPTTWIILISAGAFTLSGNLASAQHTPGGYLAAGWPAWSAIGALVLSGVHSRPEPVVTPVTLAAEVRTATEVTFRRGQVRTPVTLAADPEPEARVTARVISADPDPEPEVKVNELGCADPVTLALRSEWTPGSPLTREVRVKVMTLTGVSESTVKRVAAGMRVSS